MSHEIMSPTLLFTLATNQIHVLCNFQVSSPKVSRYKVRSE